MIRIAVLIIHFLSGANEAAPAQTDLVRVFYSPFRMSDGHRLDTFEMNALCKFERDPRDPAMRRVWDIVANAPEVSDPSATFDTDIVRLEVIHGGLHQTYWVDQRGRVRGSSSKAARRIDKAALAQLDSALEDMCPRTKRVKDARGANAPKGKAK